jgi:hypothetical protein
MCMTRSTNSNKFLIYKGETTYKSRSTQGVEGFRILTVDQNDEIQHQTITTFRVMAYIDAAFTTHDDSKSHSGVAVFVTRVLVFASSKKQGCVTKIPTKSELVALTNNLGFVELFEELVTFLVNDKMPTPIIYQDRSSVVTLVTHGRGVTRIRHLWNHMHRSKEAVDMGRVIIRHCKAKFIIADGFMKPLDGSEF